MSLTLTYDNALSRVRVAATELPSSTTYATVQRSSDQVTWTTVRGGAALVPTATAVTLDDYEFSADVANYYRVQTYDTDGDQIGPTLNANPFFETDASNWTGLDGATHVRSTAQAHEGTASLLVTPNGSGVNPRAESNLVPVVTGVTYRASAWVRCAVARTVDIQIAWFTAGSSFISLAGAGIAVPAGIWTLAQGAFVAPATAALGRVVVRMTGTPPNTHLLHVDEASIVRVDSGPQFSGSITPTLDGVWIKSVARPFLNRQVTVVDHTAVERRGRAGVFDVVGRSFPVSVSDVRGSRRWELEVMTETRDEAEDFDLLLASGDVLLIHVPAASDVPGGYVAVGDTSERRRARKSIARVFSLSCVEVAAPGPDVVGATSNWQTVLNNYATWQDVLNAHATWQDLLELIGSPTDVIVP
ncbi:carbohydrate binding domain-containing protein [Micromonospora arida]